MLFLAIFGKNVEDAFGHLRYLAFYVTGGFASAALQTATPLLFGTDADARISMLGASGAISAVLGAFLALYPHARIKTLALVFVVQVPAWLYLGGWFSTSSAKRDTRSSTGREGAGSLFAHIGGFVFGWIVARALLETERRRTESPARHPALTPL
jgi:membrane associated rhomboid family serine protease